jgi:hypothetical protein
VPKLNEKLQQRAANPQEYEQQVAGLYNAKKASLQKLSSNKDFQVYLQIEAEMNDPKIVIAHNCTDAICMSLKHKIRDYWKRSRLLEKIQGGPRESHS